MVAMVKPEMSVEELVPLVESGVIRIPQFQRGFVWTLNQAAGFIDSVIMNYPTGSFMLWHSAVEMGAREIKGMPKIEELKPGKNYTYVLDGQQRMTVLLACIHSSKLVIPGKKRDRKFDFGDIYFDLFSDEYSVISDEDESSVVILGKEVQKRIKDGAARENFIIAGHLYNWDVKENGSQHPHLSKILDYQKRFRDYTFPIGNIGEKEIDVATKIFTRINTTGKNLNIFEIMVAKTYQDKVFDLSEKYEKWQDDKLAGNDYETLDETISLRVAALLLERRCEKKDILGLKKNDFISAWEGKITHAIDRSIDLLRNVIGVEVSELLPYPPAIIPLFSYFYSENNLRDATPEQERLLKEFFWRSVLSGRYTAQVPTKIVEDLNLIRGILAKVRPGYTNDFALDVSPRYIREKGIFKPGDAYTSAILSIYASQNPNNFNSPDNKVRVTNRYMTDKKANNLHHFFPTNSPCVKGLKTKKIDVNHTLNITFIDGNLNKKIRNQDPKDYMGDYRKNFTDEEFAKMLATHLIGDGTFKSLSDWGIWSNNYEDFVSKRAERVSQEIKNRIIFDKNIGDVG